MRVPVFMVFKFPSILNLVGSGIIKVIKLLRLIQNKIIDLRPFGDIMPLTSIIISLVQNA
jgi:hypothetical protein